MTILNLPILENPIKTKKNGNELSRLISAAVVNERFCELLLSDPAEALASGYNGENFCLASEEQDFILSIHAASLAEFAMKLVNHQNNNQGNGNGIWDRRRAHQEI